MHENVEIHENEFFDTAILKTAVDWLPKHRKIIWKTMEIAQKVTIIVVHRLQHIAIP